MHFFYNNFSLQKATKGFSLIEVLVSMGLFSLGLLSIIALQLQAHRAIADSSLKSQALSFASSRYEIYYLEHTNNKDSAHLSSKWQKNAQAVLPDLKVNNQIENDRALILFWATTQPSVSCKWIESQDMDCLQL